MSDRLKPGPMRKSLLNVQTNKKTRKNKKHVSNEDSPINIVGHGSLFFMF